MRRWALISILVLALGGCGGARHDRPNVLLVTFDTLRADHVGCYGYESIETPAIDALAARGILFENAYATIPVTLPSHASILTGLYPHQHGVRDNGVYRLDEETTTLAEVLQSAGYETAAFVGAYVLDSDFRIDQGFDHYDDEMDEPLQGEDPFAGGDRFPSYTNRWLERWKQPYQRRAEAVVERAIAWLAGRERTAPFFCWVHLFDPHHAYTPPEPWASMYDPDYDGPVDGTSAGLAKAAEEHGGQVLARDFGRMITLYDGEISYADHWLGELLGSIPESTLVVFTADHGEAFGEHGQFFEHILTIHRETLHVPLILAGPPVEARSSRRGDLAGTIDIVPTVLDALHLPTPPELPGRSLLESPSDTTPERTLYSETLCSRTAVPTRIGSKGVRTRDWSLIHRIAKPDRVLEKRLFHVAADPAEERDLMETEPERADRMASAFEELRALALVDELDPPNFWEFGDDEERLEQLRSLGYID